MVTVGYVGIRNRPEKSALLARTTPTPGHASVADLAFDCLRHIEFLELTIGDPLADLASTNYWQFQRALGRSSEEADERCKQFLVLYEQIAAAGFAEDRPIAVTDDHMRLDGSHRVSIARVLGIVDLPVAIYRWRDVCSARTLRSLREEASLKRERQLELVGKQALDPSSGKKVGTVVSVSTKRSRRRPFRAFREEPLVVVRLDDGSLAFHPDARFRYE